MAKEAIEDLTCKEQMSGLKALTEQGMRVEHFLKLEKNPVYAKKVVECMLRDGREMSPDYKIAKAIMHRNFFGVEAWQKFGLHITKRMYEAANNFPWGEEVLNAPCPFGNNKERLVRDSHIAFLGLGHEGSLPLKPRRLAKLCAPIGSVHFGINPDRLAKQACDLRWYLMPIYPSLWVGGSDDWESRLGKLPDGYEQSYFIEELVKALLLKLGGLASLEGRVSYGCRDLLDHSRVAELLIAGQRDLESTDFTLLATWPATRRSNAAGDSQSATPPFTVGVSRKLPA